MNANQNRPVISPETATAIIALANYYAGVEGQLWPTVEADDNPNTPEIKEWHRASQAMHGLAILAQDFGIQG